MVEKKEDPKESKTIIRNKSAKKIVPKTSESIIVKQEMKEKVV